MSLRVPYATLTVAPFPGAVYVSDLVENEGAEVTEIAA